MEDQAEENLDGSSIKPVSSLRSHFEQMTKATAKPVVPPTRSISPKPKFHETTHTNSNLLLSGIGGQASLRPPGSDVLPTNASSTGAVGQRLTSIGPVSSPALSPTVTIEPPSSPPKDLSLNLTLVNPSAFLTTSGPQASSTSGSSSPRHFRIPSRPHTPLLEPRKSPSSPRMQPPEPPPPRRSGEMRRDASIKMSMGPPPVNRAEKPKMSTKNSTFLPRAIEEPSVVAHAVPTLALLDPAMSFSTSPSSSSSSERDARTSLISRSRLSRTEPSSRSQTPKLFDPPPIHHAVANRRKDTNNESLSRATLSPHLTGDSKEERPMLPARPSVNMNSVSLRTSTDLPRATRDPIPLADPLKSSKVAGGDVPFPTPPKRNFSTPTSQRQTPPRTHGRSMTVDQASDRAPTEFRIAKVSTSSTEKSQSLAVLPAPVNPNDSTLPNHVEYPDTSHSNRRPPRLKRGHTEIATRSDTRIVDVCGDYVCTSGHTTRIWSLLDGYEIINIPHGETIKITSMAFKPATEPSDEGSALWLGNNFGEILEVEITSQIPIVASNNIAHSRREITRIHRHRNEMWTLDDSGTLNVWGPDSQGTPDLGAPSSTRQVPKSSTFSIVVGDELWLATGNDIRIFLPALDAKTQFQMLQRPLSHAGVGDVTSGAIINNQPNRVYFGHSDGKVSIYARQSYICIGTINVSTYKINSLAGAGDYLWAAYNTGRIHVYDTTHDPWMVKKEWRAHPNPVISLVSDQSSLWKFDELQVVSLGGDNVIRTWDGLLQDDWLEAEMQNQDDKFCDFEQIKTLVMTWNAGASTPHSLGRNDQDRAFFPSLLRESNTPDIIVFGFQELVDLEDKKAAAKSYFSKKNKDTSEQEHMSRQYRDWRDYLQQCLDDCMPRDQTYRLLHNASLVGLFTCVFVRGHLRDRIKDLSGAKVKRGMGGRVGNKGALILRFILDDTSVCFVNCHLAAGQTQTKDRNLDVTEILDSIALPAERVPAVQIDSYVGGGDGTMILDHEICIWNGDLNYRIDTMSRDAVINLVKAGNMAKLLERDQLLGSKKKRHGFRLRAFDEMPITFEPTYKYDVGSDMYDSSEKKRAPAWCDRILYRGRNQQRLEQLDYRRHELRVSDHRPVTGMFRMTIKTISIERRKAAWEESRRKFEEVKQKLVSRASLDFLSNVCGLDSQSSSKMLRQRMSTKP